MGFSPLYIQNQELAMIPPYHQCHHDDRKITLCLLLLMFGSLVHQLISLIALVLKSKYCFRPLLIMTKQTLHCNQYIHQVEHHIIKTQKHLFVGVGL